MKTILWLLRVVGWGILSLALLAAFGTAFYRNWKAAQSAKKCPRLCLVARAPILTGTALDKDMI